MPTALVRTLQWGLAGLLALIVIAVIVVELMSWNFLKSPITERVEAATGRTVEIRGDVSLGLLPRPHLELEDVTLANAEWARETDMVAIGSLEVTPSLISLVQGEPVIDDLEIRSPTVNLEARDERPGNWVLPAMASSGNGNESGNGQAGDTPAQNGGPPVVVKQISVSDGRLRYFPPDSDDPHELSLSMLDVSGNDVSLQATLDLASPEGEPAELPLELSATVKLGYSDNDWQLTDMEGKLGDIRLSGHAGFDTSGEVPVITSELHSPSVNVPDFLATLPESEQSSDSRGFSVPVLPELAGDLRLTVDEIVLPAVTLHKAEAHIVPGEHQLTLEKLRFDVAEGQAEVKGSVTSTEETVAAGLHGRVQAMDLYALGMGSRPGHQLAAELALDINPIDQAQTLQPEALLEALDIGIAKASYRTTGQNAGATSDLEFVLEKAEDPPAPILSVNGEFQGKALDMTVEGGALETLADGPAEYELDAHARSGELRASASTRLDALLSPETFAGDLMLQAEDGQDLEQWIGPVVPSLPSFRLTGRLSRDQDNWSVTALNGEIGATELTGDIHYTQADQPVVDVQLDVGRIELAQFLDGKASDNSSSGDDGSDSGADENKGDGGSPLAALRSFDGKLDLAAETLVLPNELELEQFQVAAGLESGRLTVEPLRFGVAGGTWHSNASIDATANPAAGTISTEFDDIALSRLGDTFTAIEDRLGILSGEVNLDIAGSLPANRRDDLAMPFIGSLNVRPSTLQFRDEEANTDLTLTLETHEPEADEQAFHIDGEGRYDGAPFDLRFRGDPLLDARDPERLYDLEMTSNIVDSRIYLDGTVRRPLALKGLDLGLELEGPNPQRLSRLIGIPLPKLPPYSVAGDLSLEDERWTFTDVRGQAGDSDLSGEVLFDTGQRPPHVEAELSSASLDLKDMGGLVGAEPEETSDQDETADPNGDQDALPDESLVTRAWDDLSADVRYRADAVRAAGIPLSNVEIDFELTDGHARFEPVRFGVGEGRVDFDIDLDSRTEPPEGTLELEVQGVDLRQALSRWPLASDSIGTVAAQGKYWITGSSVADILASADGGMVMLMTEGKLDALLVELAGLDATQAFMSWLNARDAIPINCSYADIQTRDGVARIDTLAVDTDDTTFTGTGSMDMNTEELDITINAYPKDVSVGSGRTPLHVGGTFTNIEAGLHEGGLALRTGASAALAALAGPLAALLPLMDLGSGEDVPYCDDLVSRSRNAIDEDQETGNDDNDAES